MAKRDFYIKDSELDDYQVKIINKKIDSSFIVKGCAGSGKSILALWKARQLQEQNKRYLFVVYTKVLKEYMKDGIIQIGLKPENIVHYDSCFAWSRNEFGRPNRGHWIKGDYEYIILDEAQDLSIEDIKVLQSHSQKILIYGDSAQQLYDFKDDKETASIEDIAYFTKYPLEQLVFNHRLPKKIARFAQKLNSESDELEDRCTIEGSMKPKILTYTSKKEQFEAIVSLIQNKNMEDVGILFRKNDEIDEAYDYLTELGLDVEAKSNRHRATELDFSSNNPKLMTYHSAKGLQFENVFLPECVSEDRNPLYVAITRTYSELYILHSGNLSPLFDCIPVDTYDTSLSTGTKITI